MKESGQKGCVVYLHHTTPHFPNTFWLSKHVNMKKSLQLNFISWQCGWHMFLMKTSTKLIESATCQLFEMERSCCFYCFHEVVLTADYKRQLRCSLG